ncbi:hypothetical protein [Haloglomus salinum]|uniref:hypothetical protein n=1 Tax=Haloglomus salinum TaxID=2962673 RepID=UPI0020C9DEE9|nr:hypothetical protein [Haloglomus salinum]
MRTTSPRWRRLVECLILLVTAAYVSSGRRALDTGVGGDGPTDGTDAPEMEVELERVTVGDDLSVTGAGLDPTLIADVLELNEGAAELVDAAEDEFIREPIETATGGAVEVPDVEDELARRVRESNVSETAIDELDALGGLFGFGSRRRRRDRETADEDESTDDTTGDE